MWCAEGQTPQMRCVMRGISSAARPMQNRSNPRSSGICRYALATSPWSSRKISILPWPSRRVMGSMVMRWLIRSLQCAAGAGGTSAARTGRTCPPGRESGRGACRSRPRSFGARIDAKAERNLAPWSKTSSIGPMQPRHGMLPSMQRLPQPERVAGPMQMKPWARKHSSGSAMCVAGRLISVSLDLVRLASPCAGSRRSRPCWG